MQKYTLFIGIDISKQTFDACIAWSSQSGEIPHQQFEQSEKGYNKFLKWIAKTARVYCPCERQAWFVYGEHTGLYGMRLVQFLSTHDIACLLDSPLRISRSLGLKRQKDDKTDAKDIARCAMRRDVKQQVRPIPATVLLKVQALLSFRARLLRYVRGLQVASNELVFSTQTQIHQPVQTATKEIGTKMEKQIRDCERQIKTLLFSEPELKRIYELVCSVVGIGQIITAYFLVYTNGFTAFDNARQFNCFIGTAPFKYKSGTSINQKDRVNSMANHKLKALFSMAAVSAIQHDPQIKAFWNKSLERGKEEPWIYNAIKAKLVKRVFAVVQRGTPYVVLDKHFG